MNWGGSVVDISSLKNLDTTELTEGVAYVVQEKLDWYFFRRFSSAVADDDLVINPSLGQGQWLRKPSSGNGYEIKSASYSAETNDRLLIDTSTAGWTLTLPGTAQPGDTIAIATSGSLETNNLILSSTHKINGRTLSATTIPTLNRNYRRFDLIYQSDSIGWIAAPGAVGFRTELAYSSDGDTNGVFYHIGSNYGAGSWSNPYPLRLGIASTGSLSTGSTYYSPPAAIVDRESSRFFTDYVNLPFVTFDLGSSLSLILKGFLYRAKADDTSYIPYALDLLGSNDNINFTNLASASSLSIPLGGYFFMQVSGQTNPYRYIRVQHPNYTYLTIGEVELYGTLIS